MSRLTSLSVLLFCLVASVISGCGFIPPNIPIYSLPEITDPMETSHIIVARGRGIGGSAQKLYIRLDGTEVAALKPLQHTEFLVSAGHHVLEVRSYHPELQGIGGYGGAIMWASPSWRFAPLEEEFKAGIEYRFLVTYDTRNEIGKIEKIEHFPEFIRLDAEKKVPTGTTNTNPELVPP